MPCGAGFRKGPGVFFAVKNMPPVYFLFTICRHHPSPGCLPCRCPTRLSSARPERDTSVSSISIIENLKIRTKMFIGFGLLLTILALVGGVGLIGLEQIRGADDIVAQHARMSVIANDIELRFANARRFVVTFAHTGDPDTASQGDKALAMTDSVIKNGLAEIKNPERQARLREIAGITGNYIASFERVKSLVRGANTLQRDVFDPTGAKLQRDFSELAEAKALTGNTAAQIMVRAGLEKFLVARLNAAKALALYEDGQYRQTEESLSVLNQALKAMEPNVQDAGVKPLFDGIVAQTGTFTDAFNRILAANKEANGLILGSMPADAARVAETAETIKNSATADQEQAESDIREAISFSRSVSLVLMLAGLAVGIGLTALIGGMISRPILGMAATMRKLAGGDTGIDVPGVGRTDEIGQMASALQVFKETRIAADRTAAAQESERVARERRSAQLDALTRGFETKAGELVGLVSTAATELQATADSMSSTAGETTGQATNVAAAAEQASANVQTVAAAAEELASSVNEISRQVAQSAKVAGKAREDARRTDSVVLALSDGAKKIGEVVGLISNIAGQTNLLALNATIEAARAGDAGKGFAVVASEVKSLATQTAKATDDIARQIAQIQNATKDAVDSIRGIGTTIGEISEIAATIAAAVEEQGSATQEIARNVQQAATGTQQVSANIVGVSQGANDTGAAANQVLGAAGQLSRQAERLRQEVDQFIAGVKAA